MIVKTVCSLALMLAIYPAHASRVKVLAYSRGVMERVAHRHADPGYARSGDYVPGFHPRPLCGSTYTPGCVDGYTAVNYRSRSLLRSNPVIVADVYSPRLGLWVRQRLQPTDWQRLQDSTGEVQRLEVDGHTASRLGFYGSATHARIVGVEHPD